MKMKLCLILLIIFAMMPITANVSAAQPQWPEESSKGRPFFPSDKYVTMQNPPDFSWPCVQGASYDIKVCRDAELTDVAYHAENISTNYINFNCVFEPATYYWSVCYKNGSTISEWSQARRFRIDPDAWKFPVPSLEEMLARIPKSHPRIWTTPQTLDALRDTSATAFKKKYYDKIIADAEKYIGTEIPKEPIYAPTGNFVADSQQKLSLNSQALQTVDRAMNSAFAYLISGDTRYAEVGAATLENLAQWDINGATSYTNQDQTHRAIAYKSAMAYDWLQDVLTEQQKIKIIQMIRQRTLVMTDHLLQSKPIAEWPYDSHGWTAYGYIGIIAVAMYDEIPEAKGWLNTVLTSYINILPPWSHEDGGWSQGTDYWQYSSQSNYEFMDVLKFAGIFDLDGKAYSKNSIYFPLYMFPKGSIGAFGDQSYREPKPTYSGYNLARTAAVEKSGVAKWAMEQVGEPEVKLSGYLYTDYGDVKAQPPVQLPTAHFFKDTNWAALHSDLMDPNRISLFFKSSPYGSFNHSHADQNSFVIQAYSQPLAIESGYYDAYHSTHDSGYTRKTYAHNAITIDGGKGQKDDDFDANGKMTAFLNHPDFDLVSGDATPAYKGILKKAVRHIVYIRPNTYVVIDDLQAKGEHGSFFEWWLNGQEKISTYESGTGARVEMGVAALDAKVQYPAVKAYYSDRFSGPELVNIPAEGNYVNSPVQKRVWFETEKLAKTKMVTTLDVHKTSEDAQFVKSQTFDDYLKLEFEDGTTVIVNLTDKDEITADGITFSGAAAAYNGKSVLLTNGTKLSTDGKTIIESEKPISVVLGKDELGISTQDDVHFSVSVDNVSKVTDRDRRELGEKLGIVMQREDGRLIFDADKGEYSLVLNDKPMMGEKGEDITFNAIIDGSSNKTVYESYLSSDGSVNAIAKLSIPDGRYKITDKSDSANLLNANVGDIIKISDGTQVVLKGDTKPYVQLESIVPSRTCNVETIEDHEAVKASADVFIEAEDADKIVDGSIYDSRKFMSGGAGITNLNAPDSAAEYTVDIKEAGNYDMVIKHVAWLTDVDTVRTVSINGEYLAFVCPVTPGWGSVPEDWRAMRIDTNLHLEPGKYPMKLECLGNGGWNYDWIAFVKRED